jgi:hypothetical protein
MGFYLPWVDFRSEHRASGGALLRRLIASALRCHARQSNKTRRWSDAERHDDHTQWIQPFAATQHDIYALWRTDMSQDPR